MNINKIISKNSQVKNVEACVSLIDGAIEYQSSDGSPQNQKFVLTNILIRPDFKDNTCYCLMSDGSVINLYANTYIGKISAKDYFIALGKSCLLFLLVKSSANTSSIELVAPLGEKDKLSVDGDLTLGGTINFLNELLPSLSVSESSRNDEIITFSVKSSCLDPLTIYAESSTGILLNYKAKMIDGKAEFKLATAGIPSGTSIELKVGFKYFSNKSNITVTV